MPQTTNATRPITVVTHDGGLRLIADVRGHVVATDQPYTAGGTDSAAMPLELIGAALGTCIALAVVQFCNTRDIPTDGLSVSVEQHTAKTPYRVDRYQVGLILPHALPTEYREAIDRVARTCAAYNTLRGTPDILISVSPD